MGYNPVEKIVSIASKPFTVQLFTRKNIKALSGLMVISKKPLVKQEDDKTIVDAEALANSSANAYEVFL